MTEFIDPFSKEVWEQTYKDHTDNTIDDNFRRVAKAIASVEKTEELRTEWEDKFYDLLSDFKGTCGGRTYSNAGTEWAGTTLLNCFVSPRGSNDIDSLDNIIDDLKNQTFTLKSEGGWGQNFSWIRPRGTFIHGVGVETPGAVKYMELYDKASEIITSGSGKKSSNSKSKGKIRKGAMMAVLDVSSPDIIEFITAKQQSGRLSKFNLSVNCTEEFMTKLLRVLELKKSEQDYSTEDKWDLRYPDTTFKKYKKEWNGHIDEWEAKGYPVIVYQTVSILWLWNLIMESTYNRAEPGVLFLDRANDLNPANYMERISATNPCFTGNTIVATADGRNGVSIKQLAEESNGIESFPVYSARRRANSKTGPIVKTEIKNAVAFKTGTKEVIKVVLSNNTTFECTPDHRIATNDGNWIFAKDSKGVKLQRFSTFSNKNTKKSYRTNNDIFVSDVIWEGKTEDVYDLTVEDNSNFYIITDSDDDKFLNCSGVLVHNCGEQVLAPGGVCCLGSMNVTQFVTETGVDIARFKKYVGYMVRFLDNVNEFSDAPLKEYVDSMKNKRRIGVGILGWGSALFMLKTKFASEKANVIRDELMSALATTAYETSIDLAIEKGMFKYCEPEKHAVGKFVSSLNLSNEHIEKMKVTGIRNSSLISIQPTGNTSIMANIVSGGLEPVFMPEYIRTIIVGVVPDEIKDITPNWHEGEWKETSLFKFAKEGDEEILRGVFNGEVYKIDKNRGLTKEVACVDYGVRYLKVKSDWDSAAEYAVTALSGLTAEDHLNDLIGFTRWIDSAASKCMSLDNTMIIINDKIVYLDELPFSQHEDSFCEIIGNRTLNHKKEYVDVVSTYNNGNQETLQITFDDMSSIICTPNHKLYTKNGWIAADDIKIGIKL